MRDNKRLFPGHFSWGQVELRIKSSKDKQCHFYKCKSESKLFRDGAVFRKAIGGSIIIK